MRIPKKELKLIGLIESIVYNKFTDRIIPHMQELPAPGGGYRFVDLLTRLYSRKGFFSFFHFNTKTKFPNLFILV